MSIDRIVCLDTCCRCKRTNAPFYPRRVNGVAVGRQSSCIQCNRERVRNYQSKWWDSVRKGLRHARALLREIEKCKWRCSGCKKRAIAIQEYLEPMKKHVKF